MTYHFRARLSGLCESDPWNCWLVKKLQSLAAIALVPTGRFRPALAVGVSRMAANNSFKPTPLCCAA